MLRTPLIHPELLAALARCGHGAKILLADGNYPHTTGVPAGAERIALNVTRDLLTVDQVLAPLLRTIAVESAEYMVDAAAVTASREDGTPEQTDGEAVAGYRGALPGVPFTGHERFAFYDIARGPNVALVVATGDQRQYANLLLTVGVVTS